MEIVNEINRVEKNDSKHVTNAEKYEEARMKKAIVSNTAINLTTKDVEKATKMVLKNADKFII